MATTERSSTPATEHLVTRHYGKSESVLEVPHLIEMPKRSYERFLRESLRDLFDEILADRGLHRDAHVARVHRVPPGGAQALRA